MRPIYENKITLETEIRISKIIEEKWNCSVKKLPRKNYIDFAAYRNNQLISFLEIRVRGVYKNTYPTLMISLEKWVNIQHISKISNLPAVFLIEWKDGLYWIKQDNVTYSVDVGGSEKRNDDLDYELCVFIPVDQFKKL